MTRVAISAISLLVLSACGGGGGSGGGGGDEPIVVLPSSSRTFENTQAIDPLASFKAVQLPDPHNSNFDYRKQANGIHLELNEYLNPDANLPNDLLPMAHRAFKAWSRRIDRLITVESGHQFSHREPGVDGKAVVDFVAGYTITTGCNVACANHGGDPQFPPAGRSGQTPVVVTAQDYFGDRNLVTAGNEIGVNGFRVLAHEFGHIFDYAAPPGQGAIDNGSYEEYHRDCSTEGVMCQHWQEGTPITPTDQDFNGITHHYSLKGPSDYEVFGIWASIRNTNSSLHEFGIRVTRTLMVDPVNRISNEAVESFIQDNIRVEALIDGTRSSGPVGGTGTATWTGDLIAVDTGRFQPVLGDASLTLNFANIDMLTANFTNISRSDNAGAYHNIPNFSYTLTKSGSTYADSQGTIDANFYTIGTDATAAVAGRIDDASRSLMGVYGAIRDDVPVPDPTSVVVVN